MNKVICRMYGGLGNQLFIYAAARRLAIANGVELVIDDVSGFVNDHTYRRQYQLNHFNIQCLRATTAERLEPFSRLRRFIKRSWNMQRAFIMRNYIREEGLDFDRRLLQVHPRGTLYLEGYWQSENYFKDVEETIRNDLRITPPNDAANHAMAARMGACLSVAVHVRFFDAPADVGGNNAPVNYYARAVAVMEARVPGAHYFIFSDRPEAARATIQLSDERVTCVSHNQGDENAYADLWLITQCKHFIIANSTFSWWGAWLARHAGKLVIAPGFETRQGKMSWGFEGLLPKEWIRL